MAKHQWQSYLKRGLSKYVSFLMEFNLEEYPALERLVVRLYEVDQFMSNLVRQWAFAERGESHALMGNYVADHFVYEVAIQIILNWLAEYYG